MSTIIKGQFVSVWDEGSVSTYAELDTKSGELLNVQMVDGNTDMGTLEREYFEDKEGNEYEVCITCHGFILKAEMNEGVGKQLIEDTACPNPNCESNF